MYWSEKAKWLEIISLCRISKKKLSTFCQKWKKAKSNSILCMYNDRDKKVFVNCFTYWWQISEKQVSKFDRLLVMNISSFLSKQVKQTGRKMGLSYCQTSTYIFLKKQSIHSLMNSFFFGGLGFDFNCTTELGKTRGLSSNYIKKFVKTISWWHFIGYYQDLRGKNKSALIF